MTPDISERAFEDAIESALPRHGPDAPRGRAETAAGSFTRTRPSRCLASAQAGPELSAEGGDRMWLETARNSR